MSLTSDVLSHALALGFDRAAVLPVGAPRYAAQFATWLAAGYHGEMAYLAARAAERLDLARYAPGAASVILVAANYDPCTCSPPPGDSLQGRIARYACWPDYHEVIKPRLFALDAFIRGQTGRESLGKAFVDAAPVLERDFAEQAGLGFIGRNTCLITPGLGSWTVLAGLFVPEVLEAGSWMLEAGSWMLEAGSWMLEAGSWMLEAGNWKPGTGAARRGMEHGCGRCTRCLDACPTGAFVGPHVLDARRCISYLTIELRGPIPRDLRPLLGSWVFGCDVCQAVCPYNRVMSRSGIEALAGSVGDAINRLKPRVQDCEPLLGKHVFQDPVLATSLPLTELLALDEATFRARFRGTPVLRAKRRGLVRNACIAAGNSGVPALVPALIALLADPEPLVRGHAAWALGRLGGGEAAAGLTHARAVESDPWVGEEIALACAAFGE